MAVVILLSTYRNHFNEFIQWRGNEDVSDDPEIFLTNSFYSPRQLETFLEPISAESPARIVPV